MECQCECGVIAPNGLFLPGHDQKLRIDLENRVGGIMAMRELVEAAEKFSRGKSNSTVLAKTVESIFSRSGRTN
ncbi:MAG: hypothetical protein ACLPXT_03735 [Terracidiphilus sp.]